MDKYFEIQEGCALYNAYFAHKEDSPKIAAAYKKVCAEFGIESKEFYVSKNSLHIVPTEADMEKFESLMKKSSCGEFKKNSAPHKMWISLVKGIEHFEKPKMIYYFRLIGHRWRERLFDFDGKLYCSIDIDGDIETPDFATEMKASEFFKIVEGIWDKDAGASQLQ